MKKPMSGKANHRKCWRMAEVMADEARRALGLQGNIPDWAGLAWIIDPFYNSRAARIVEIMGATWMARARLLCRAMAR